MSAQPAPFPSTIAASADSVLRTIDELPPLSWAQKLAYLVYRFHGGGQQECPIRVSFEPKLYIREIEIPAGILFIGRVHTKGHECELVSGRLIHITEHYRHNRCAPDRIHTTPGYQMVFYTLTPIVGRTRHENPTDSRDTEALDTDFAEPLENLLKLGAEVHAQIQGSLECHTSQLQS